MNDEHDDLDRALFALPLEVPPADLRAAILRATVYASQTVAAPFGRAETIALGVVLALASWLAIVCATDRAVVSVIDDLLFGVLSALTDVRILLWLALGGAVAFTLSLANPTALRLPFRGGRSS
ncbi:MAG: hypothetical protein IAI49_14520 [Candidatus Eremiobacteraeota bacterium]|nr:hypothetical protein [Candidatus Eremiobacteraeota bacterium]